jgi:hypothetical protein
MQGRRLRDWHARYLDYILCFPREAVRTEAGGNRVETSSEVSERVSHYRRFHPNRVARYKPTPASFDLAKSRYRGRNVVFPLELKLHRVTMMNLKGDVLSASWKGHLYPNAAHRRRGVREVDQSLARVSLLFSRHAGLPAADTSHSKLSCG